MNIKKIFILHLVVLVPMWLCGQNSGQPASNATTKKTNSASNAKGAPALNAIAAIDRYEESLAIPANPNGPELARKARLAVNKASQSDPASAGDLEILLTQVSIINLDHMKMTLGRPAPLQADTAKYRKLRDDLLEKLKKKPGTTRPAKSS